MRSHQILSLKISGGFLDGMHATFAPGLNCVIGARGTGKTTTLEFMHYALLGCQGEYDAPVSKRLAELIKKNLGGGRIELTIQTKDGLRYTISRAAEEPSVVTGGDGQPVEVSFRSGLFNTDIFSQNEVEGIADDPISQLELIDNFEVEALRDLNTALSQKSAALQMNASALRPIREEIERLRDAVATTKPVEEQLKAYKTEETADAKEMNRAHEAKALRDREDRAGQSLVDGIKTFRTDAGRLKGRLGATVRSALAAELLKGPNGDQMTAMQDTMAALVARVEEHLADIERLLSGSEAELISQRAKLALTHKQRELEFRALLEKQRIALGEAAERTALERRRNELLAARQKLAEQQQRLEELNAERRTLLDELAALRDQRFKLRKKVVERINLDLNPTIRVGITQSGYIDDYRAKIAETFRANQIRSPAVAAKLAQSLSPADLVEAVRKPDFELLRDRLGLTKEQSERVVSALNNPDFLLELEGFELLDLPSIELLHGDQYKPSSSLSTGQKCTSILPILLLESASPLLIDQPEDNLDNSFIYDTIVEKLRKIKTQRQLIFITHNPNVVVLGNSDMVFVMESDGKVARIAKSGTVDECKTPIVKSLEGGKQAFEMRRERYKF